MPFVYPGAIHFPLANRNALPVLLFTQVFEEARFHYYLQCFHTIRPSIAPPCLGSKVTPPRGRLGVAFGSPFGIIWSPAGLPGEQQGCSGKPLGPPFDARSCPGESP